MNLLAPSFVLLSLLAGCAQQSSISEEKPPTPSVCYVIYDAGSSGTRLYLYERQGPEWVEHVGPEVAALSDPVREIRGKSWDDRAAVTDEVTAALDDLLHEGPLNKKGKPEWHAFDWEKKCRVAAVQVYATAGMRIAEQENRKLSMELWRLLKRKLAARLGHSVKIQARTLTGFEEGMYAWLAVRKAKQAENFGIVEMGGASSQITFPCAGCDATNDAVRDIVVGNRRMRMYSYSFLGLGQDEAPKSLGFPAACAYGVGLQNRGWRVDACASQITLETTGGIRDPYNYALDRRGAVVQIPQQKSEVKTWFLTGAFNYMDESDIESCCLNRGPCYNKQTSCFRAVYLQEYLYSLGVSARAEKLDANWTRGALICTLNNCLQQAEEPVCRWSPGGCS
jgi:hypothetical protein